MMLIPGVSTIKRSLVLLAAMGLLVSACGSGGQESSGAPVDTETTAPVAGAQENAVGSGAVCYGWPDGTTDAQPCAVGVMGPGGGRVFYDAGSEQSWGRFLEVAPQDWNGLLTSCNFLSFNCGTADKERFPKKTGDEEYAQGGYYPCRSSDTAKWLVLAGELSRTLPGVGDGRRNTDLLLQAAGCYDGTKSAIERVMNYRIKSGRSDWYLPSIEELTKLCNYEGRNGIGGFVNQVYLSSTAGPITDGGPTNFVGIDFAGNPRCEQQNVLDSAQDLSYSKNAVRPIRAFSGSSTGQQVN